MITALQDLIAKLDLYLPWLLPALETFEETIPATARVALCALLTVWFVMRRQRHAAASRLHRALL